MTERQSVRAPTVMGLALPKVAAADAPPPVALLTLAAERIASGRTMLPLLTSADAVRTALATAESLPDLTRSVVAEPALALEVFRVVNEGRTAEAHIGAFEQAVERAGADAIRSAWEHVCRTGLAADDHDAVARDLRKVRTNIHFTGFAARELARWTSACDPELAHVAGVVHNVGELLILRMLADPGGEGVAAFSSARLTRALIRDTHESVGALLAEACELPAEVVALCRSHHGDLGTPLGAVVQLAYEAALDYGYTYLGVEPDPVRRDAALGYLRLDVAHLAGLPHRIGAELNVLLAQT